MAYTLRQAMDERKSNTENQFFTTLMQYSMHSEPQFDFSGNTPKMINAGSKIPNKAVLWNQYVEIKGGRVKQEDILKFEEYYKNLKSIEQSNQLKGLQGGVQNNQVNVGITMNNNSKGQAQVSGDMMKGIGALIGTKIQQTLMEEARPGGMLSADNRGI